jgi:hypothetical protein
LRRASGLFTSDNGGDLKVSIQATMIMAAIFAVVCLGVAINGFSSIGGIADPAQASDASGFAWFWTFLAGVAAGVVLLGWRLARTQEAEEGA